MKKLLALSLALVMALGLAACGTPSEPAEDENQEDANASATTEIKGVDEIVSWQSAFTSCSNIFLVMPYFSS